MLFSCESIFKKKMSLVGISKDNGRLVASVADFTIAVSSRGVGGGLIECAFHNLALCLFAHVCVLLFPGLHFLGGAGVVRQLG